MSLRQRKKRVSRLVPGDRFSHDPMGVVTLLCLPERRGDGYFLTADRGQVWTRTRRVLFYGNVPEYDAWADVEEFA